ncbi:hypothetical protein FNV43_RR00073 [Rhamnella rubrinervis]|uniref:Uncharacterized protein n=1 Tax=Rhamnella rubrinervis TaxID=2594499 RepID=A0A8K0HM56_9ROSA|nr:hypothetical protein FNV43_RR00073 [Rhamnella rubrinervis]
MNIYDLQGLVFEGGGERKGMDGIVVGIVGMEVMFGSDRKGSLDAEEQVGKAHARASELEKQATIEAQQKEKEALQARANEAEKKIKELGLTIEKVLESALDAQSLWLHLYVDKCISLYFRHMLLDKLLNKRRKEAEDRARVVDVQADFQQAGLNVDTPAWMHADSENNEA